VLYSRAQAEPLIEPRPPPPSMIPPGPSALAAGPTPASMMNGDGH
jgi:hypothetical protein